MVGLLVLLTQLLVVMMLPGTAAAGIAEVAQVVRNSYRAQSDQFRIHSVVVPAGQAATFQKLELQFELDAAYDNPFDPDDIKVEAEITLPSGQTVAVPAFYSVPYRSLDGQTWLEGGVSYIKSGEPCWMVRYTPTEPGAYDIWLVAEKPQGNGTARVKTGPFRVQVAPASGLGFVAQSEDSPLYFENAGDGSLFYPVGVNIAWTRRGDPKHGRPYGSMDYYFRKAAGNMTATRVWMCHYAWLEWMPQESFAPGNSWSGYGGLGYYNQMVASAFDRIFEMAEKLDLRIMLTLDDNDEHDRTTQGRHGWTFNPYNALNGGPCADPTCVFSEPEARLAYKKRLRYILARWGYSTSLWALNTWNDFSNPTEVQVAWVKEMRDYVHLLTDEIRPLFFGTNFRFGAQAVVDYAQAEKGEIIVGKPNLIQEVYYTRDEKWFLHTLRYELWSNLARGRSGVMVWPHHVVDSLNAWTPVFRNVADFVKHIPLHRKVFEPIRARVTAASLPPSSDEIAETEGLLKVVTLSQYGDVPDWGVKAPRDTWDIDIRANNHYLEGLGSKLYGERRDRVIWRTTPTFNIDLPAPGKMMVRIKEVSGTVRIRVRDHGEIVADRLYSNQGRWYPQDEWEYLMVPLASGGHSLTLSVDGSGDWAALDQIYFVYEVPAITQALDLFGLSSGEEAFLFIWNPTYDEVFQKVIDGKPQRFEGIEIEVAGLKDGIYIVQILDAESGQPLQVDEGISSGGLLHAALARVDGGVLVRISGGE